VIEFRPLAEPDLPLLSEWLRRPHVAEWWDGASSLAEVRAKYLPRISSGSVRPYVASQDGKALGFIQSYRAMECGGGWWPDEYDPGVMGVDQFLADADSLGRGLGSEMVRRFVAFLARDPGVTRVQADPMPRNSRAIRCYEKAGFRRVGVIETPDGPALLMVIDIEGKHAPAASELRML